MELDVNMGGRLEKTIDNAINMISSFIDTFHEPALKSKLHITNEEDFILGWSYGYIIDNFSNDFISTKKRLANTEEMKEAYNILELQKYEMSYLKVYKQYLSVYCK